MCTSKLSAEEFDRVREYSRRLILERNAVAVDPLPLCKGCGYPLDEPDWLWPGRCVTCAANRLESLLWKIKSRFGRKTTILLLKRLASK